MSPAEALLHYRAHGVSQLPAVHAISVPLQPPPPHDLLRPSLSPCAPAPAQHHAADPKQPYFHPTPPLPVNLQQHQGLIDQGQEWHGQPQPLEQPPPQEHLQGRRRDIFGPPIARFAPTELPRIVLPLRSACGMKPTVMAAPANAASPCAPGRASMPVPASPAPVVTERHKHEVVGSLALEFDMCSVSIGEMVGRGAFGEVYKATYRGKEVAVKQIMTNHVPSHMMQDIQSEFQKEVEVMQKLNHPNIVAYIGSSVLGSGVAGDPRRVSYTCTMRYTAVDAMRQCAFIKSN
jgi:hypothetical protein